MSFKHDMSTFQFPGVAISILMIYHLRIKLLWNYQQTFQTKREFSKRVNTLHDKREHTKNKGLIECLLSFGSRLINKTIRWACWTGKFLITQQFKKRDSNINIASVTNTFKMPMKQTLYRRRTSM